MQILTYYVLCTYLYVHADCFLNNLCMVFVWFTLCSCALMTNIVILHQGAAIVLYLMEVPMTLLIKLSNWFISYTETLLACCFYHFLILILVI